MNTMEMTRQIKKEMCIGMSVTIVYKEEKFDIMMTTLHELIVDKYQVTKNNSDIGKGCLVPIIQTDQRMEAA